MSEDKTALKTMHDFRRSSALSMIVAYGGSAFAQPAPYDPLTASNRSPQ
jgi:hypothetical protein